jgi:hypothetical protein
MHSLVTVRHSVNGLYVTHFTSYPAQGQYGLCLWVMYIDYIRGRAPALPAPGSPRASAFFLLWSLGFFVISYFFMILYLVLWAAALDLNRARLLNRFKCTNWLHFLLPGGTAASPGEDAAGRKALASSRRGRGLRRRRPPAPPPPGGQ